MEQRTYSYGVKAPLVGDQGRTQQWGKRTLKGENALTVDPNVREQLWLGHKYQNELTAPSREFHATREAIRRPYVEARRAEYESRKATGEKDVELPRIQLSEADAAKLAEAQAQLKSARKEARSASDVLWGTRGQVDAFTEQALKDACKAKRTKKGYFPSGRPPRFSRWDGSGLIAVQCQGGLPVPALLAGDDTRVRLAGSGKYRVLWLRIGSDGRKPIWSKFPLVYHRELPEHGVIKWVRVLAVRRATKLRWMAQFILEGEQLNPLPAPTLGTVGIDIGWRIRENGDVRVAVWADDAGQQGELHLSAAWVDRWEKTESLQAIRDRHFDAAIKALIEARVSRGATWPEWLQVETRYLAQWRTYRSVARLARLVWRWRKEAASVEPETLQQLEAWRKQDKHLYEWQRNQFANVLAARKDIYRRFAKHLAKYRQVALEKMDLHKFAETPREDEPADTPVTANARPRRFKVALSTLRAAIMDAVVRADGEWLGVEPAYTTKICSTCGVKNDFDAARQVDFTCTGCGAVQDQDANAARNLLRAAQSGAGVKQRSNAQTRATEAEMKLAARRKRLLTMLTARRSKKAT